MRRRGRDLTLLAVAVGGAVGAWARLGLAELLPTEPGRWPWGTFAANIVGCLLLGYAGHPPDGAPAAQHLPAPVHRHRRLRRAHDVLGLPARGGRPRPRRPRGARGRPTWSSRSRSAWSRWRSRPGSCAAPAWCPRERRVVVDRRRGARARSGRSRGSRSTARSAGAARGDMPWGTLTRERDRRPRWSASPSAPASTATRACCRSAASRLVHHLLDLDASRPSGWPRRGRGAWRWPQHRRQRASWASPPSRWAGGSGSLA